MNIRMIVLVLVYMISGYTAVRAFKNARKSSRKLHKEISELLTINDELDDIIKEHNIKIN